MAPALSPVSPASPVGAAAARAAVAAAASLGVRCAEPALLADGANVIVHLRPSPVVAKVAASTTAIRPDPARWLQRELDLAAFLTRAGAPVMAPSPEVPATAHRAGGHVMTIRVFPADNHFFFPGAGPSSPAELATAQHVDPDVIAVIRDWLTTPS
jgi:hypothetical protein